MASSEPPKKEDKGKGMPKKEALDAHVTKLSTSLQEMMADGEMSGQESSANETPLTMCRTDPSRSAPTDGLWHRESYCLLVRVVKDAIGLSERDVRLPAHAWNEDIAVDICVESDMELMDESDNSDASSVWSGCASLHSQHSTTENKDRKRVSRRLKATYSDRATNTKKGIKGRTPDGKKSMVVLSMFQDSKKEGELEYADWRAEVEEYIKKGYEDNKIKDAMLFSLEGKARRNFWHCDEHGDLSPAEILKQMDMSYNASIDFRDLNARLCGLKQGAFESPKDYYDRMVDIGVALREYHQDHFQPGELSRIEKECFFAGLRDQSKYLVSHMKDKREYGLVDMLKELRENDEARYPANTAHRPRKLEG